MNKKFSKLAHWCKACCIVGMLLGSAGYAYAVAAESASSSAVPPIAKSGEFASVAAANAVLQEVARKRDLVQAEYAQDELACQPKFFMASCLEDAKEKRRLALEQLRPQEISAERYKRAIKVQERDSALAEKQREHAEQMPKRILAQKKREEERSARDAKAQTEVDAAKAAVAAAQRAQELAKRQSEVDEKARLRLANRAADAQKHAEKLAEYDKKQEAAAQREKDLAKRQKEKQEKNAAAEKARIEQLEKDQLRAKAALGK